jgi:hypothetical protein
MAAVIVDFVGQVSLNFGVTSLAARSVHGTTKSERANEGIELPAGSDEMRLNFNLRSRTI